MKSAKRQHDERNDTSDKLITGKLIALLSNACHIICLMLIWQDIEPKNIFRYHSYDHQRKNA